MFPILFKLGNVEFYSYGLMIGIGFVLGVWLAQKRAKEKGVDPDSLFWLFVLLLVGGVVGGRLFHLLMNIDYYQDWRGVLDTRNGGLSIHGVLFGGVICLLAYVRTKKVSFLELADLLAPSVALGQGIGRIGCFLSGCCYGVKTSGNWGFHTRFVPGLRHPYQLYESVADLLLVAAILSVSGKSKLQGAAFFTYIAGYSGVRFFLEFFRDNESYVRGLSYGQWVSLAVFATTIIFAYAGKLKQKNKVASES